MFLNNAVIDKN